MDKFAVFVDAGYVLACGAELLHNAPAKRYAALCAYGPLIKALVQDLNSRCGLQLLRVYWYDGAKDQLHTPDHLAIGGLPDVKVRLGRVVGRQQKGVDTLIVLDLTTLARERALSTAYVVSGDEDLREAVAVAQQMGVRVCLVGLQPLNPQRLNQAPTLIREADEHIVLETARLVTPFFSPAPGFSITVPTATATPATAPAQALPAVAQQAPAPVAASGPTAAFQLGSRFGTTWLSSNPPATDLATVTGGKHARPRSIPQGIDSELLRRGAAALVPPPLITRT